MVEEAKRLQAEPFAPAPALSAPILKVPVAQDLDAYDATSATAFLQIASPNKSVPRPHFGPSRNERKALRKAAKRKARLERKNRNRSKREAWPDYYAGYVAYINSAEWRAFRLLTFSLRGKRCERCGEEEGQRHLHHLTYRNLGHEEQEDVMVLCRECHKAAHPETQKAA